ncbi:MAG: type II toxin-antitoxin system VapC family toxin [Treponema sp.]|jgi:predicted nucleic acid-binding protein|nr:type II toxin-antitoxin system VapC family toxin [Treponema sp.]
MIYVLDACALLSFLNDEPGSDIVDDLLIRAVEGKTDIFMNIINLVEVHYANIRSIGSDRAAVILEKILAAPIQIVSVVSEVLFQQSARLKASYKCSLADAIGLATSIELSGQFVTSDHHELEAIAEKENISFLWLPSRPKK